MNGSKLWRRGWDSNPRWICTHGGFQDRCLKPLGHPSKLLIPSESCISHRCPESCFATALLPFRSEVSSRAVRITASTLAAASAVTERRLYQLSRQLKSIVDRQFKIEFRDSGVGFCVNIRLIPHVIIEPGTFAMDTTSEEINWPRRLFFGGAVVTVAAAQLGITGSAAAQTGEPKGARLAAAKPGTNTSFGPIRQIDAGILNVGYAEAGPGDSPPVILLHGWPYDIHSYVDVATMLASAGYRTIIPYLRGYGTTRFLASETIRN